ncbi:MAG TPA: LacI family DNA-binding transcriptional regulator [Microbacteriaceae bacterium]
MGATLREIADAAGVSVRTVSNVVNNYKHVSPAMRAAVQKQLTAFGYAPNLHARSLKRGKSDLLALVLPELDNPYFAELAREVVEYGAELGYTVMIDHTNGDAERERQLILYAGQTALFDGLIVSPLGLSHADLEPVVPQQPVVFLGEDLHPGFDHVSIDNRAAAIEATNHLLSLGCKSVVALGGETTLNPMSALRRAGYYEALVAAGIPSAQHRAVLSYGFERRHGAEAMQHILAEELPPDGVFCLTDTLAHGALRAIHNAGLRVPEDIAVLGFDDIAESQYSTPTLTSVSPDKTQIARTCLDLVISRVNGTGEPPRHHVTPHTLVVRESTMRDSAVLNDTVLKSTVLKTTARENPVVAPSDHVTSSSTQP